MENEIIIGPKDFCGKDIIYRELYIDRNNKALIIGNVKDERHSVIGNSVIVIYEEICSVNRKEVGFTMTDEDGNFRVLLEPSPNKNYILEVFYLIIK